MRRKDAMSISSSASSEAEEIQRIAYELWQIDGESLGREGEHWERARRIFESRKAFSGNGHDREAREPEEAPRLTPDMQDDLAPDISDPSMDRFARPLQNLPGGRI